ncbi:MAG: transposase zinc-binding domain-containing protein, partial [Myxococcales bacterium]
MGGAPELGAGDYERTEGAAFEPLPRGYRPRRPERSVLHEVVRENLETFSERTFEELGRELPRFVSSAFAKYLKCGVLAHGFARVRCGGCGYELLVGFSCKVRGLCPSCDARRMHDATEHLLTRVLPGADYRQWVLSFPFRLRFLLARDTRLMRRCLDALLKTVFAFHRRRARRLGLTSPQSGAVSFPQRFGSALNLNLHFHCIVLDGVYHQPAGAAAPVLQP